MAKRVTFGKAKKKRVDVSFNFGFNAMSKVQKKAFRKKAGGKGGGS
jgi:hypothetical protein